LNKRKTLIIKAVDCPYCLSLANSYKESFNELGGTIVKELSILEADRDFSKVIEEARNYTYDSVLLPNYAMQVAGIIAAMLKDGVKTTFLGGDGWLWTEKAFDVVGNKSFVGYSVNTWLPEFPTKKSKDFIVKYNKTYADKINDTVPHFYDTAIYLFEALKRSSSYTREELKRELLKTKVIDGVTGKMVFNGNNYPERPLLIMKTTNYRQKMLKVIYP